MPQKLELGIGLEVVVWLIDDAFLSSYMVIASHHTNVYILGMIVHYKPWMIAYKCMDYVPQYHAQKDLWYTNVPYWNAAQYTT